MARASTVRRMAWCCAFAFAGIAGAEDTIIFNDGTVLKGRVIAQNSDTVTFEGEISGIKTTQVFQRSKIYAVNKDTDKKDPADIPAALPPGQSPRNAPPPAESPALTVPAVPSAPKETAKAGDWIEVELKGTFGEDFFPLGIKQACDWAVKHGVTDVVFRIDSGGGRVWAARAIQNVMDEFEDKLHFHAVVRKAYSASIWVLFNCDDIAVLPGSSLGGAVIFHENGQTGAKEVDGKFNAIMASDLSSKAKLHGHSGDLARAMILPDAQLYAALDSSGRWNLVREQPDASKYQEVVPLNKGERVIALDEEECGKYGVARRISRLNEDTIREILNKPGAVTAGDSAQKAAKAGNEQAARVKKKVETWFQEVDLNFKKLRESGQSKDGVKSTLERLRGLLQQLGSLKREAANAQLGPYVDELDINVRPIIDAVDEGLRKLNK